MEKNLESWKIFQIPHRKSYRKRVFKGSIFQKIAKKESKKDTFFQKFRRRKTQPQIPPSIRSLISSTACHYKLILQLLIRFVIIYGLRLILSNWGNKNAGSSKYLGFSFENNWKFSLIGGQLSSINKQEQASALQSGHVFWF